MNYSISHYSGLFCKPPSTMQPTPENQPTTQNPTLGTDDESTSARCVGFITRRQKVTEDLVDAPKYPPLSASLKESAAARKEDPAALKQRLNIRSKIYHFSTYFHQPHAAITRPPLNPSPSIYFAILPSRIHGFGLFASKGIAQGRYIVQYTGEVIRTPVLKLRALRSEIDNDTTYAMSLTPPDYPPSTSLCIEATRKGNFARFMNHSCEPNLLSQQHSEDPIIYFRALRDIRAGEELTYDYNIKNGDKTKCFCKSSSCTGKF